MTWQVELFVELMVPDVVALTARDSLRRRLGWEQRLRALTRADYWRLEVEAPSPAEARALGSALAERTTLFVNPNKHRYRVRVQGEETSPAEPPSAGEFASVSVLTGFQDDVTGDLTLRALHTRYPWREEVRAVERGTLWTLQFAAASEEEARRWAEEIVLTRRREQGLLVNPHSQWWRWAG